MQRTGQMPGQTLTVTGSDVKGSRIPAESREGLPDFRVQQLHAG